MFWQNTIPKFITDFNGEESDEPPEQNNENIDIQQELEIKQLKKKKKLPKDETEQPVYPCDSCIKCFTTQRDLKVNIHVI